MDEIKNKEHLTTADLAGRQDQPLEKPQGMQPRTGPAGAAMAPEAAPLVPERESNDLRSRWDAIQAGFVDEPRSAVKQADELVASAMKRIAEVFSDERAKLERQWDRGDNISTEDLRVAFQRYRSFFSRLLSI